MVTEYADIMRRVHQYNPASYGRTRNFVDGNVSRLSPFISRGVTSTRAVLESCVNRGFSLEANEKFFQELAWRDYWQQIWIEKGGLIDQDLTHKQETVSEWMPANACIAKTGITGVDRGILELYKTGYMHNHVRMYTASILTNVAKTDWKIPAKWMYYYLLDADWGSNALSWQWVAATSRAKKYYANQDNINAFCRTDDRDTFLDHTYPHIARMDVPNVLKERIEIELITVLPETGVPVLDRAKSTAVYTMYNLDPKWREHEELNRVLFFPREHFKEFPVCSNTIDFISRLAQNIDGIQMYAGEMHELRSNYPEMKFIMKEHPFYSMHADQVDDREWIVPNARAKGSFFSYWKQVKAGLKEAFSEGGFEHRMD